MHSGATDAEHTVQGAIRGKPVKTTISDKAAPCPMGSASTASSWVSRPNALWVSDFTYVVTWTGFVYVAFVINAYARRIVGWRAPHGARMRASFSMRWNRPCMNDVPCIAAGSCITATGAANTSRSNTPSVWRKLASNLL